MRRALAGLTLLVLAAAAEAQAPPSFREGVIAFEKKEWKNAEKAMRDAIAGNPKEVDGTVQISGQWFETYVPHYFLARSLAKLGRCQEALAEFAESERQGVTPAIGDFARHLESRDGCRPGGKGAKAPRVTSEVTVPFGEERIPPATTQTVPPPPETRANDAPRALLGSAIAGGTQLLQSSQRESGDRVAAARGVLENAMRAAKSLSSNASPADVELRARSVEQAVANLQVVRRIETRTRLTMAVDAYLRGNYAETARLLGDGEFGDRAAAAEAALFRAAARHALYRIGGQRDDALRQQVAMDLQHYRALRPGGHPDPRVFPPAFIAMTRR